MGHGSSGGCKLGSIITPGDLSCRLPTVSGPFSWERASLHGLPQPQLGFGFSLALYSPPGYVCISSSPQPTSSAPQISMIPLSSAIMPSHVQGKKSLVARAAQHQAQQKAQVMSPSPQQGSGLRPYTPLLGHFILFSIKTTPSLP